MHTQAEGAVGFGEILVMDYAIPKRHKIIAHTHTYYGTPTYPEDYDLKNTYPGISHSIYYDGAFRGY